MTKTSVTSSQLYGSWCSVYIHADLFRVHFQGNGSCHYTNIDLIPVNNLQSETCYLHLETIYTEYRGLMESFVTWCNDNHVRSTSTKSMSLCWTTAVYLLVFTFTKRNKNSCNDSACEHIQGKDWFYTLQNMEASDTHVQLCTVSRWAVSPVQYLIKCEIWSQSPFCSWVMGLYEDQKSVDLLIRNVITSSF